MEAYGAKYNGENPAETQTAKNLIKKLQRTAVVFTDEDLYEVTIKYFTACRDSLQVAAVRVLQRLYIKRDEVNKRQNGRLIMSA